MNELVRLFTLRCLLIVLCPFSLAAQQFPFTDSNKGLQVLYSKEGPPLDSITAHLLAHDIQLVTGREPVVITDLAAAKGNVIVIAQAASSLLKAFKPKLSRRIDSLAGAWESFYMEVVDNPGSIISKALVIAGSDARGTAYGVFTLSEKLGVSPWYWWADVPVKQQTALTLTLPPFLSAAPFVKYRGIFINDEDWGLQPWAAKTFEPETGDIGPKTYAKVFELLLRLKANLIWPAMHPSTKAFFHYPGNRKMAEDYSIVIGTSHAEPMLRNNVDEWDEKTMGRFNYLTNKEKVSQYWESRVKETVTNDAIYTMGMRGVHDSGMEGVKNPKEAAPLLEQIIQYQRNLLTKYRGNDSARTPKAFTVYKEVLDIYDNGLRVPDDITIVWPDDNYGYIQRLNNEEESKRSGGAGVYYHASYWGRPHDYLWLSSTHPALLCEEMEKALLTGANKIWVLNVGDIKPLEYITQLFLDLAYNPASATFKSNSRDHLYRWANMLFGEDYGNRVGTALWAYYQLAFERKPEFMGWSRTEPTTATSYTQYNHFYFGDEAQRRIDAYDIAEKNVKSLRKRIAPAAQAAFYELVYYPIVCAAWMNKKFLYNDKSAVYAKQHRISASDYAVMAAAAYDSIVKETAYYNNLLNGKWRNMMHMSPRELPVFKAVVPRPLELDNRETWNVLPEGYVTADSALTGITARLQLPAFDNHNRQRYFIDLFLNNFNPVDWKAVPSHPWIRLTADHGRLEAQPYKNQLRVWVDVDFSETGADTLLNGVILFRAGDHEIPVGVKVRQLPVPKQLRYGTFIENNGYVSIHAANKTRERSNKIFSRWRTLKELGYARSVLQVAIGGLQPKPLPKEVDKVKDTATYVAYDFYTFTAAAPVVHVFTLPTHPLNNNGGMRYAVSIDGGPITIVDFSTIGRSEEWKENVLSNRATRKVTLPFLKAGSHTLKLYPIDPGVVFDEIRIDLGGLQKAYSVLPQTVYDPGKSVIQKNKTH